MSIDITAVAYLKKQWGTISRVMCCLVQEECGLDRTTLGEMKSFDNLSKTDVVFFSFKVEDLEATARTLLEVTSWMDWWTYAGKSLALCSSSYTDMVNCPFVVGARCQLLVAKTASTSWVNVLLKRLDAFLGKLKGNIRFESFLKL